MSDSEPEKSTDEGLKPERADVELTEAAIKSLGFPDTERPPTNPLGSVSDSASSTGSGDDTGADSNSDQ